jgi:YHS domain-containing protein
MVKRKLYAPPKSKLKTDPGFIDKGKMVKCSTCGTYFSEREAIQIEKKGVNYCFCSKECREQMKEKSKAN